MKETTVDVADILRRRSKNGRIDITDPDDVKSFWGEMNQRWDAEFETLPSGEIRRRQGAQPQGLWQRLAAWWRNRR